MLSSLLPQACRGGGKVGILVLDFHFSTAHNFPILFWRAGPLEIGNSRRSCGNVGISPALGEISKGLVERVGKPAFGFPRFPPAPPFPQLSSPSGFSSWRPPPASF